MTMPSLSLREVSARRGGRMVVDGVSLTVQPGEWIALVGPNGAGKSTVLSMAAGLLPPSHGEVALSGRSLTRWPSRARAQQLGWLGQSPDGDGDMAVQDVVALGRLPHHGWLSWGAQRSAGQPLAPADPVMEAMERADVAHLAAQPLGCLSGGERQRVHLARVLAGQAPILLLDEPLAHLDAPHQRAVAELIRDAVRRGCGVLSVLHELPFALAADRVAVMDQGRLLAFGPASELAVREALLQVFDHAIVLAEVDGGWTAWPRLG